MDADTHLFIEVWNRLTHDWARLMTFRQMGVLGEDAAREAIHQSNTYFVEQSLLQGEYKKLLKDPEVFRREGLTEQMPQAMTESAVNDYRNTLHSATLVFAHSILDAALFDCLRVCAAAAPSEWSELLHDRKVALGEVAAKPFPTLLAEAIDAELVRLERKSLLAKVDRIFQLCRPEKQVYLTNGFRFDRNRLVQLDDLRHEVVHAPGERRSFATIYEDLQFMQSSGIHVFVLVGEHHGLVFSGREAMELLSARPRVSQ